ncbi:MAG: hypothetical protein HY056_14750 [Proteobacteria bacterium]|nr:hypothetical protein [Pseudomonadota bacterium]
MLVGLSGLIISIGSMTALVALRPRDGVARPIVLKPFLDTMIPVSITSGIALGIAAFVAGVAQMLG